jgi:hypothetical protein
MAVKLKKKNKSTEQRIWFFKSNETWERYKDNESTFERFRKFVLQLDDMESRNGWKL